MLKSRPAISAVLAVASLFGSAGASETADGDIGLKQLGHQKFRECMRQDDEIDCLERQEFADC